MKNDMMKIMELSDEILKLVYHWEDFTTSDLQGISEAIIMKAIQYGREVKP